jgi:type III secretion protein T
VDVGLGIMARSADKLEPNALSQPLRGMIGMIMLIALVAVFASQVVGDVLLGDLGNQLATGMLGAPAP